MLFSELWNRQLNKKKTRRPQICETRKPIPIFESYINKLLSFWQLLDRNLAIWRTLFETVGDKLQP